METRIVMLIVGSISLLSFLSTHLAGVQFVFWLYWFMSLIITYFVCRRIDQDELSL